MACEMLLQLNAIRVLLEACSDKQRVDTPYTRDQVSRSGGPCPEPVSVKAEGRGPGLGSGISMACGTESVLLVVFLGKVKECVLHMPHALGASPQVPCSPPFPSPPLEGLPPSPSVHPQRQRGTMGRSLNLLQRSGSSFVGS